VRRLRLVVAALLVVLVAPLAHAWTPTTFHPYCGTAAFWVSDRAEARDPDLATAAAYAAATADPDQPASTNCPTVATAARLSDALGRALARLSQEPFPTSPAPVRLGPVRQQDGVTGVRYYVDPAEEGIAFTLSCLRPAADTLGLLTVAADGLQSLSTVTLPYVAAHELVHVVQGAQPLVRSICPQRLPLWLIEGTADAFASLHIRETLPSFQPGTFSGAGRNLLGLRPYTVALAAPDEQGSLAGLRSYRASSLFRFVVERWHGGDHALWAEAMGVPSPSGNDGLAWLDDVLRDPRFGVEQPLALVFPSFLASYAGWGHPTSTRWPHIGEANWFNVAFGACEQIVLTPGQPAVTQTIQIEPLAGRCVEVVVDGVEAGTIASVEIAARGGSEEDVDDLHLAAVEMGAEPTDGGPRTCLEAEAMAPTAFPACVFRAFTAHYDGSFFREVWTRTFAATTVDAPGTSWTDRMLLVRAPADPSDATHGNRSKKAYDVTFTLQLATAAVDGNALPAVQAGGNFSAPGDNGPPIVGQEFVGPTLNMDRVMFGQETPGAGAQLGLAEVAGPGLFAVFLGTGGNTDDDVGITFGITVGEDGAIPPGTLGSFPAGISGSDPRRPGLSGTIIGAYGDDVTARVTVLAWDADHVRLNVRGEWCYASEMQEDRGCAVVRTLDADVWLPFGDAYDGTSPYRGVDTPVQALYREVYGRALGFGPGMMTLPGGPAPAPSPTAPPGDPGPATSDGGSIEFECACTCDGLAELEAFARELENAGPEAMGQAGALAQCAMTCAPQWATCEP
jgi:hypothetical protein